jgi:hypothetical protein
MQPNQVISQLSHVTSGGGTKHKRRRRVRTLKATYGRAYRKYNQMYGGAGEVVPDPKKEEAASPGLFTTLTNKLFGSKEDDAKKKAEEEAANKKKAEEEAAAAATAVPEGDGKSLIEKAEDAATGALKTVEGKAAEIKDGIVKTTTDLKDRATIAASVLVPSTGDDGAKNAAAMDAVASNAAEKEAEDDDNKSVSSEGSSSSDSSSSDSSSSSGSESDNEDGEPKNGDGDGDGAEEVAATTSAAAATSDDDSSLSEDKRRIKELEKKVEMLTTGPLAEAARAAKDAAAAVESAMESMKLAAIAANAASAAASAIAISVNSEKFTNSKETTPTATVTPPMEPSEGSTDAPEADDTAAPKAVGTSKEFTDAQSLLGKDEPPKDTGATLRGLNAEELEPEVKTLEEGNPDVKKGGKNRHKHRKSNHNGTRKH